MVTTRGAGDILQIQDALLGLLNELLAVLKVHLKLVARHRQLRSRALQAVQLLLSSLQLIRRQPQLLLRLLVLVVEVAHLLRGDRVGELGAHAARLRTTATTGHDTGRLDELAGQGHNLVALL